MSQPSWSMLAQAPVLSDCATMRLASTTLDSPCPAENPESEASQRRLQEATQHRDALSAALVTLEQERAWGDLTALRRVLRSHGVAIEFPVEL